MRAKSFFIRDGRLRSGWRVPVYLLVLALTYLVVTLPVMIFRLDLHYGYQQLLQLVVVLVGTWVCRRFVDKRDWASFGLRLDRQGVIDIGLGLLLGAALMTGIFLLELAMGWIKVIGFAWQTRPLGELIQSLFWRIVVQMTVVAVTEEVVMRGYLLPTLEEGLGLPWAVVLSSSVFGVLHLFNPMAYRWATYVIPFTLTMAGVMLALAYLVRRTLWLPIALHFAWNTFEYEIFALIGAAPKTARFLVTEIVGPPLFVGLPDSAFGPEVGLLGVLAMSAGIVVLWRMYRRTLLRQDLQDEALTANHANLR
ncbi:MAG TPA: CPBP family intramembrane metalloprotease [Anaerolineae bacterium]|nr:CPBP family intramembrane metalloprotease [Anaerolineae bacterium]